PMICRCPPVSVHALIMGVRHRQWKMEGWQFHPESFLTQPGVDLLRRFLHW
ncbi:MAG: hypothetical protein AAFP69_14205, partial [Planctomycetota bacterium]